MKVETDKAAGMILKEVFEGVLLETREGTKMGVCQRDFGYELHLFGHDQFGPIFVVNLETRTIARVGRDKKKMNDRERVERLAAELGVTPHPKHWSPIHEALEAVRVDERDLCVDDCEQIEMDLGNEHDPLCDCVTMVEDECNCHLASFRKKILERHSREVLKIAGSRINRLIDNAIIGEDS